MPSKKKRNNKPKSAKTMNTNQTPITIHHSSPTFQHQEKEHQQERPLRTSSMEDTSPKENVHVESVQTLEIADDDNNNNNNKPETEPVTETKRDISILEDIIDKTEKILDGDEEEKDGSSSSSSDDEKEAVVEPEPENEDKVESSVVENLGIDSIIPSVVEDSVSSVGTELVKPSSPENEGGDESPIIDIVDQKSDEVEEKNIAEESKLVVDEPSIEDQIAPNIPSDEPAVSKDSSQATSWKSCCGLFEFLKRSER